ncbi:MAG: hypothetical protein IH977_15510 [Nitrospinae bacterium]|nr:hypothetical protein [Nitrospinota bacterium]
MNWRTLMKGGEATKNLPKIPKITPNRSLEGGFEDIGEVLDEVKTPSPGQQPTQKSGGEEPASAIKVDSSVWYHLPGKPEVGPCQVTSLNDLGWSMVQIVENGKWVWVHRSLIARVQIGNG